MSVSAQIVIPRVSVIDSHTGGEPTRVVMDGGPDLGSGSMAERMARFRADFDYFRRAVVNEPRGSDVLVGALLLPPANPDCAAGVIFFNNVGYLGMCGHGTIGLIVTLAHLGRTAPGVHLIETPVGVVTTQLHMSGLVSVQNIAAYRYAKEVSVTVPGWGTVRGDVAWGGNWFFLVTECAFATPALDLRYVDSLTEITWAIRQALTAAGVTGAAGAEIDHIELFAPSPTPGADSRNFVLCPGKAYDRSPCGTGTSAKLACLYEDGKLAPGASYRQESVTGSVFEGTIEPDPETGDLIPTITGSAFVTAEATLLLNPADPLRYGIE